MLRVAIAFAWLGCANLQNLASALPADGIWVAVCGSDHLVRLPLPGRKQPGRECAAGCHSTCRRADVSEACDDAGIEQQRHPARWDDLHVKGAVVRHDRKRPYNANAGPMRNAEMVALGADMCLALHRRIRLAKGTRDCALRAIEAGIPTYLIDSDAGDPRRLLVSDLV